MAGAWLGPETFALSEGLRSSRPSCGVTARCAGIIRSSSCSRSGRTFFLGAFEVGRGERPRSARVIRCNMMHLVEMEVIVGGDLTPFRESPSEWLAAFGPDLLADAGQHRPLLGR